MPLRVTFDSNVWEKIVAPDDYPDDPKRHALKTVHDALRAGRIAGFISETFATLEAIRKVDRAAFLERRAEDLLKITWHPPTDQSSVAISGTVHVGGTSRAHPGLGEKLTTRLQQARTLGFLLIPGSRIGTARPPVIDDEAFRIPLTDEQRNDIWPFLEHRAAIAGAIEERGVGFAKIENLAKALQIREGLNPMPWYEGLNRPADAAENKKIAAAFAEWADGDTVSGHIAYELDILCTEDHGKGAGHSVFDPVNRQWLSDQYGVVFNTLEELAGAC